MPVGRQRGRSLPVFVRACGRIGCALFSSNWYCLAHGGHAALQGGGGGGAYLAAAAAAVVSLAISPQPGQVSRPGGAHCWPKSQVDREREGEGERDANIRCGQVDFSLSPFWTFIACGRKASFVHSQPNLDPWGPRNCNIVWAAAH